MLVKGNKIKMIKEIGSQKLLNQIFEVVKISNDIIEFSHNYYGKGVMSYKEFEEYFELIKEVKSTEMIGA